MWVQLKDLPDGVYGPVPTHFSVVAMDRKPEFSPTHPHLLTGIFLVNAGRYRNLRRGVYKVGSGECSPKRWVYIQAEW